MGFLVALEEVYPNTPSSTMLDVRGSKSTELWSQLKPLRFHAKPQFVACDSVIRIGGANEEAF
jgi:hypothetical protein